MFCQETVNHPDGESK